MKFVVDTNVFLNNTSIVENNSFTIVVLSHVLRELEKHKTSGKPHLAYAAREATRKIESYERNIEYDLKDYKFSLNSKFDPDYQDNNIIQACVDNGYGLITEDLLLKQKAKGLGIEVKDFKIDTTEIKEYKGYKEIEMSKEQLHNVYENLDKNEWDLLVNEYLIVLDEEGNDIDCFKWDGNYLLRVNPKGFTTSSFGKFKPYDFYQKAVVDSIVNNDITSIKGKAGSGKSLIALNAAWHFIEKKGYDRLVVFTNPVKTKNAEALGFYKGTRTEKLLDSQIGIMLSSKFGDEMAVQMAINNGRLVLLPFSDIRGFDTTSEQKTLVWLSEAQNLNVDLMKLGLERIGDNTKVIVDGDPNTQVDMDIYRTNNGMKRMSQVFRGDSTYGEIELKKIYRSHIAEMASQM